jgi:hypothetical protein
MTTVKSLKECETVSETNTIRLILEEFVRDINDTGGVWMDSKGLPHPMGEPNWIDLGVTYLKACDVIGVCATYSYIAPDGLAD